MKHLLNNMSEEEKNSIREQHSGGMKVMTENFSKLLNSKLGDVKPLNEQTNTTPTTNTPPATNQGQNNVTPVSIEVTSTDLNQLYKDFKQKLNQTLENKKYMFRSSEGPAVNSNNAITFKLYLETGIERPGLTFDTFTILFNEVGAPKESLNNVLTKNPGSRKIWDGKLTFNNKNYESHLVGLNR